MVYSDFTLKKIKTELKINIVEKESLFISVMGIISSMLGSVLNYAPLFEFKA